MTFDSITYSTNNTGEHCVFMINIHTCKCTTWIFILMRFGLSNWYNIQDITGWLFLNNPTRCWQVCVISFSFYSTQLLSWLLLFGFRIASLWSSLSFVSALYRYYKNYGLVYVIDMNTHDLFFYWYNMHFITLQGDC